jgi:glucose/mannose-6-phosphate isomerase
LESIALLEQTCTQINSSNLSEANPSLDLARWISGIPIIYYPAGLQAAAIRFKNSLQENAKMHAMAEDILEACHNGIVSWERKSSVTPILLRGADDYVKTKERWEIIKQYFKDNNMLDISS